MIKSTYQPVLNAQNNQPSTLIYGQRSTRISITSFYGTFCQIVQSLLVYKNDHFYCCFRQSLQIMVGSLRINEQCRLFSLIKTRTTTLKKRTIVVGLKSDNSSREMLLRLLNFVVVAGDNVLAVHVQDSNDFFDPNTFHIHEDLCKSKQVWIHIFIFFIYVRKSLVFNCL